MKKLSTLLTQRQALLHKVYLANLAFAYTTLQQFHRCIERAQVTGRVTLKQAAPHAERYWASLVALDMNQSIIEEHFSDEAIMELADVMAFLTGNDALEISFDLDDLSELFLVPIRVELEREGITIDRPTAEIEEPRAQE
jgi:hypothetical protein